MLLSAIEYPAQCEAFPYDLGYCQVGSNLEYDADAMDLRNMLWFKVGTHAVSKYQVGSMRIPSWQTADLHENIVLQLLSALSIMMVAGCVSCMVLSALVQ